MDIFNDQNPEYYKYLDDIWHRIYSLVVSFTIFFVIGFLFSGKILKFVVTAFSLKSATIVTTSPFQFFDLAMTIGMYVGFIVCVPLFLYHSYQFLKGGLNLKERKFFFVLLPIGLLLFVGGFAYGVTVLNFTLDSIASINLGLGIQNFWDITSFLSQVVFTSLLLGIIFQFPIVLSFLVKSGFLNVDFLRNKRRHAFVIMFIVTSILPPTDGFSLVIMVVPLVVIYEATIMVNAYSLRRKLSLAGHSAGEMRVAGH